MQLCKVLHKSQTRIVNISIILRLSKLQKLYENKRGSTIAISYNTPKKEINKQHTSTSGDMQVSN
jgi:hypothetical protein